MPAENIALVETLIEPWFIFALIWSVGATCDGEGRKKFSEYLRKKMDDEKVIPKVFIVLTPILWHLDL